jgi:hypothetical protein
MTILTEGRHAAEFILSEANGHRSRDNVVILGGSGGAGRLAAGTVLGKLTSGGKYVPSPATGADGSQTGVAVLIYPVDATDADVTAAVVSRDAEVNKNILTYDETVNDAGKKATKLAQLAAVGIIGR